MHKYLFALLGLMSSFTHAQSKLLNGVVEVAGHEVENIHILNLSNEKSTITNAKGEFIIEAATGDLLVFSALHLDYWRQSVKDHDFNEGKIRIKMTPKVNQLSEVVVTDQAQLTAKGLGIINYTPKTMTVAQRRLHAASGGNLLSVDNIINWISGRTKQLRQNVDLEYSEKLRTRLSLYCNENYCIETLKIPEEYVGGFYYFATDNKDLVLSLEAKNIEQVKLKLADLSLAYLLLVEEYELSLKKN